MPSIAFFNNEFNDFSGSDLSGSDLSGSGSGSGSDLSGSGDLNTFSSDFSGSGSKKYSNDSGDWLVVIIVTCPFIICFVICFILNFYNLINYTKKKIFNKCNAMTESKNKPIVKNQLNKKFINNLNTENHTKINKTVQLDCSICIEIIELHKFQLTKNKLVFLNCGHVYHTPCLQSWVKSQIKQINKPNCPLCRGIIVNYSKNVEDVTTYDSDSSVASYWND
jgi:hypothetical protein